MAFVFSILAPSFWCWLIVTSQRSPMRGIMHWMSGLTPFWLLIATLSMPWIDYGKSYRPLSASLAGPLPTKAYCIANANLPVSILASLDYFDRIRTVPLQSTVGKACNWLLIQGEARDPAAISASGWRKVWEGKRPGDRRNSEKFNLFRRDTRGNKADALPDHLVAPPEAGTSSP